MIEEYLHLDLKKIGIFSSCVLLTALVVTALFWFFFGFNTWKRDMSTAADLMTAAAVSPVLHQQRQQPIGTTPQYTPMVGQATGQFVCPTHGAVGLPNYDANSTPHCPLDGQIMQFHSFGNSNYSLAAGAG